MRLNNLVLDEFKYWAEVRKKIKVFVVSAISLIIGVIARRKKKNEMCESM